MRRGNEQFWGGQRFTMGIFGLHVANGDNGQVATRQIGVGIPKS